LGDCETRLSNVPQPAAGNRNQLLIWKGRVLDRVFARWFRYRRANRTSRR
jgi:hypothetical protein